VLPEVRQVEGVDVSMLKMRSVADCRAETPQGLAGGGMAAIMTKY
jgi:hypothetical protein